MNSLSRNWIAVLTITLGYVCAGLALRPDLPTSVTKVETSEGPTPFAKAKLSARSGSKVKGDVTFSKKGDALQVGINLSGATPGEHGFHIHEKGDCSAADASSAGEHYNPTGEKHGGPGTVEHHAGDFGNVEVGADGTGRATIDIRSDKAAVEWDKIVGKAIVLHQSKDDLETQPSGDSGARIACGVIRPVNAVSE